jgi:hypothetical protein
MDIKIVPTLQAPLQRRTPRQVAKGRNTVTVHLEEEITLEIDGSILVTYPRGLSAAPCEVANALAAQGADIVRADGTFIERDAAPKPKPARYPSPFSGSMRFPI